MSHRSSGIDHLRKATRRGLAAGLVLMAAWATMPNAGAAPIQIMPLGDSITYGFSSPTNIPGGYRAELYRNLTAAGLNVQLVGSSTENADPTLPLAAAAQEGHPGYQIDGAYPVSTFSLNTYIDKWLAPGNGVNPNVVLLMAGTNSIAGQYHLAAAPYELGALVARISELRPDAKILVSTLTPQGDPSRQFQVEQFNRTISGPDGVIANLRQGGINVTLVNVGGAITPADLSDTLHPTQAGYVKLGDAWANAVLLNNPIAAPEPSTLACLAVGAIGLVCARRRHKHRHSALADAVPPRAV